MRRCIAHPHVMTPDPLATGASRELGWAWEACGAWCTAHQAERPAQED